MSATLVQTEQIFVFYQGHAEPEKGSLGWSRLGWWEMACFFLKQKGAPKEFFSFVKQICTFEGHKQDSNSFYSRVQLYMVKITWISNK